MPIQLLPTAVNLLKKQLIKTGGKKAFSGATGIDLGITPLNENEDETVELWNYSIGMHLLIPYSVRLATLIYNIQN